MKFQTGDLVLVKECKYKYRLWPRPHVRLRLRLDLDYYLHLKNTYGVITEEFNHKDVWQGDSTEDHNIYVWYSQVDAKTYWFCQSDLTQYEVAK
jgi:hypothetical protein